MIKKTIKYTDYDDVERSEDFWFNLSKSELMEMNFSKEGGMEKVLRRIIDTQDMKGLIDVFQDIIMRSYGEKSDDGKRFVKIRDGHRLAEDFAQTPAYDELYMELATDDKAAAEFINGLIPKSLAKEVAQKKLELEGSIN